MATHTSQKYATEEERVQDAVEEALRSPDKPSFTALAKKYNVNRLRISRRFQGGKSRSTREATNRKLSQGQEESLKDWIRSLDALEISARPALIEASANQLIRQGWTDPLTKPPLVGKHWVSNWVKRNEELFRVKQKPRELSRMTQDRRTIGAFFKKLAAIIKQYGIQWEDIWNVDESGFRVGAGRLQCVITMILDRAAHLASETCRDSVTCIEAVSAAGQHIAPMVIVSGALHSPAWVKNDLPDDTLLAVSPNGYTDDILALKWIQHFADRTAKMTKGTHRLLVFDGHGSHCTQQFLKICETNKIIPFSLPPHSSHLLQPLDVSVFQPYKHWHREQVDKATRTGCTNFNKIEFLAALNTIRKRTLTPNVIKNGFRLTGIWPLNPDIVLSKLPPSSPEPSAQTATTLTSPAPDLQPSNPPTPRTIRALTRTAEQIVERQGDNISPTLARFVKGAMIGVGAGALAIQSLKEQTSAQQERNKRNERARKVTQSGGVLYAAQARKIDEEKLRAEVNAQASRDWAEFKRCTRERKKEGWGKVFAEMRRQVKKRGLGGDEAGPLEHAEDEDNVFAEE